MLSHISFSLPARAESFCSSIQCTGKILKNSFDFGASDIFISFFIYIWTMLLTPSARDFILTV